MSRLYGTLSGDGRAAARTRCANRDTSASAQSWEGSVTVSIHVDSNGTHIAAIQAANGSATGGRMLWRGPLSLLVNARELRVAGDLRVRGEVQR